MYIVGFNGPPESGKDTFAQFVADALDARGCTLPVKPESLSLPLRRIAYQMVGRDYNEVTYESFKRQNFAALNRTGRQLMIDVSERFLKPTYGIEVMTKMLIERNAGFPGVLLIRDMGFQIEVDPLIRWAGEKNVFIVLVHRPGKSFDGDSREWVTHTRSWGSKLIHNNSDLSTLRVLADHFVETHLVGRLGWSL
jgi:hypothetical protein